MTSSFSAGGDLASEGSDAVLRLAGAVLGQWRKHAGLNQGDFGERIGYGVDLVASVERGRRSPSQAYMAAAEKVCDAHGTISAMEPHIRERPRSHQGTRASEASSSGLYYFAPVLLPDLFLPDTEPEPRPRADSVDHLVPDGRRTGSVSRREILGSGKPICLVADESVLTRVTDDLATHLHHLRHLAGTADRPNVTVQILPLNSGEPLGVTAPLVLLREGDEVSAVIHTGFGACRLKPSAAREAEHRFAALRSAALPPRASRDLILSTAEGIRPTPPAPTATASTSAAAGGAACWGDAVS